MESNHTRLFSAEKIKKYWKGIIPQKHDNFVDQKFPPNNHSLLGQDKNGKFIDKEDGPVKAKQINVSEIEWKRASEIFSNHLLLFDEKIECDDIKQGNLGNCYFLSALAALTEFPRLIHQIFLTKEVNPLGIYEVVLFIDGEWQIVYVDDYFPVYKDSKNLAFAKPNGNELWVILLEKIWAKINGGYANIISGLPSDPLAALTGFATQRINHKDVSLDELWEILKKSDQNDNIMCTVTFEDKSVETHGLVANHAYTLIAAKEKIHNGEIIKLVKIRNPWGNREWNGDWSDKSPLWTEEFKTYFDNLDVDVDDGTFYMSLTDFVKVYGWTQICHVSYDSNIKSFKFSGHDIQTPQVFNFYLKESSKLAISVISKHWRYNREIRNVNRPISVVVAKFNPKTKTFSEVEGDFSSQETVEYVKNFSEGLYAVWVYCNYDASQTPKPEFYNVIFCSPTKYRVRLENTDNNFQFISELMAAGVRGLNKEKICKESVVYAIGNTYLRTGIGYRAIYNKSETTYQRWENDASGFKLMSLFPPHKGENKFQFFVPPNGHAICLAMRTADWGQYWFNLDSKYFTLHCQAGEDPTNTPELNEELFISQDVCFDDEEDEDYYDYVSSSHEEAKSELKFKHINLKDVALEDLKNDYPKIIEMLLALPGEDDESYIWNKIVFNDSYYVGQLDAKTRQRRGRGAYHWEDDGITYVGYWENSQKEGSGILFDKNFSPTYEGGFLKGLKHGKGRYCFKNGDVYEGGFFEDKKHGKGTYTWKSGGSWSGPYANGQMHGKGMFTNKSGNSWEIEYRNDKAL